MSDYDKLEGFRDTLDDIRLSLENFSWWRIGSFSEGQRFEAYLTGALYDYETSISVSVEDLPQVFQAWATGVVEWANDQGIAVESWMSEEDYTIENCPPSGDYHKEIEEILSDPEIHDHFVDVYDSAMQFFCIGAYNMRDD